MPFKLIVIPEYGSSMSAPHKNESEAQQDGELLARMILSKVDLELNDDMTAQLVAARLGVAYTAAERFRNLYTPSELNGLRQMNSRHVEYIVTDENSHVRVKKLIRSDAADVALRLGVRDPLQER